MIDQLIPQLSLLTPDEYKGGVAEINKMAVDSTFNDIDKIRNGNRGVIIVTKHDSDTGSSGYQQFLNIRDQFSGKQGYYVSKTVAKIDNSYSFEIVHKGRTITVISPNKSIDLRIYLDQIGNASTISLVSDSIYSGLEMASLGKSVNHVLSAFNDVNRINCIRKMNIFSAFTTNGGFDLLMSHAIGNKYSNDTTFIDFFGSGAYFTILHRLNSWADIKFNDPDMNHVWYSIITSLDTIDSFDPFNAPAGGAYSLTGANNRNTRYPYLNLLTNTPGDPSILKYTAGRDPHYLFYPDIKFPN
jgi:hypothetical protein